MEKKLIKNYLYNILYQIVKIILPFLLAPYILSHIGEDMLGIHSFAGKIMNWFILFGILGINTYGNREIAKVRNDKKLLSKTFFEILTIQILNMVLAILAYYCFICVTVHEHLFYYQLTGLTMFASMFDITWFFYGVEDFKKASIRNIIVKCVGVGLIFLLVKSSADLWKYILINVGAELLGQVIMFAQLRQYISFERTMLKEAYSHHMKPAIQLFIPTIAISVYTMLDGTMIGYLYSETHVYFYDISMNLVKTFLYLITGIGSVVLPRVTNLYFNDNKGEEKITELVGKTMKISCMLSFPMCLGMIAIANRFISWYLPGNQIISDLIRIGAPIIVLISLSNVTGIQYMIPTGMIHQYTVSVISGSVINFTANLFLITKFGAYGAVIGSVIAESSVVIIQLALIHGKVKFGFYNRSYFVFLVSSFCMFVILLFSARFFPVSFAGTLIQVLLGIIVYAMSLFLLKEEQFMHFIHAFAFHSGK